MNLYETGSKLINHINIIFIKYVVAKDLDEAIKIIKSSYDHPGDELQSIKRVDKDLLSGDNEIVENAMELVQLVGEYCRVQGPCGLSEAIYKMKELVEIQKELRESKEVKL